MRANGLKKFYYLLSIWIVFLFLKGCNCQDNASVQVDSEIRAVPTSLLFSGASIGKAEIKSLYLKNVGNAPLEITELKIVYSSGGKNPFTLLTKVDLPKEIAPGDKLKLQIRFLPTKGGSARGYLAVSCNASNTDSDGIFKVPLQSVNLAADLQVVPNPLDFGAVKPKTTAEKKFTIANKGSATLKILGMTFLKNTEKELEIRTQIKFPLELSINKSVDITVAYTPKKPILDEYLEIRTDIKQNPRYKLRIVGQLAAPEIKVTPQKLVFDNVALGTKGIKKFTISNLGADNLEVTDIRLDANSSQEFDLPNLPNLPLTIKPKDKVEIEVSYNSTDVKDDSGNVIVESNDPVSPSVKVELIGIAKGCDIKVTPTALMFNKRENKKVSVLNKGNRPCLLKKAYFSATTSKEFSFFLPPPSNQPLNPGQKVDILVQFNPKDALDDKGELIIESDDPDNPKQKVLLSSKLSNSEPCALKASPKIVQFGFVPTGKSKKMIIQLRNEGFANCNLSRYEVNPNPSGVFSVISRIPSGGQLIPSGSRIQIEVAFTPRGSSVYQGELKIHANIKSPLAIKLLGSSGKLCIQPLPDPMDFGSVKVNCSTTKQQLQVFNLCTQPVSVTNIKLGSNTNKKFREFIITNTGGTFPKRLNYNQSFSIQMVYVARDLGVDLGSLEIYNTAPNQSPIVVTLRGEGVSTDQQKDVFKQVQKPMMDILFVIDDSCSMGDDQRNLAQNFNTFIQWASKLQVDYHIGVVTTDVGKRGCLRGFPKYITPQTPNLTSAFSRNAQVGTSGSFKEQGLEASYLALSPNQLSGCNAGFYRKDASLSIVYLSDEPDQSPKSVNFYVNFLRNLKGLRNPDKIRASAIGPKTKSYCATGGGIGCRYYTVTQMLRGIYEYIKSTNWGTTLSQLGAITFGYKTQFFLSRPADPNSISVKVNGQTVPKSSSGGWTYDPNTNSINFSKGAVPQAGAIIEVTYKAICLPPPP